MKIIKNIPDIYYLWVACIGILTLLQALDPLWFSWDDNCSHFYPWYFLNYKTLLQEGTIPLVNFHQYLGYDQYATGLNGVFYFPIYFSVLIADKILHAPHLTIEILASFHLLAGGFFAFKYFRTIKCPTDLSVYGALLFITSPIFLIGAKSWITIAYICCYTPALLWCLENWLHEKRMRWLIFSAILKALFFYQGNTQYFFFYSLLEGIYLLLRTSSFGKDVFFHWISYFFSNLCCLILILPLFLPMYLAMTESAARSIPFSNALTLVAAIEKKWFLSQIYLFYDKQYFSSGTHLFHLGGIILIPLLIWKLKLKTSHEKKQLYFYVTLFLICLLFSTNANQILQFIPPFNHFRWPFKWTFFLPIFHCAIYLTLIHQLRHRKIASNLFIHLLCLLPILSNLFVITAPKAHSAFSPVRLEPQSIKHSQSHSLTKGRSLAYKINIYDKDQSKAIYARSFNYASLTGDYAFAGYDPLASKLARSLTRYEHHTGIYQRPITQEFLDHLSYWSVRYIITENSNDIMTELTQWSQLKLLEVNDNHLIYENLQAKPFSYLLDNPEKALPTTFSANRVTIQTHQETGTLRLSLAPLKNYYYKFDHGDLQKLTPTDHNLLIDVPTGTNTVTVIYQNNLLKYLIVFAMWGTILILWLWTKYHNRQSTPTASIDQEPATTPEPEEVTEPEPVLVSTSSVSSTNSRIQLKQKPELMIIMPVYNEQESIDQVVTEWFQEIKRWTQNFTLLVINDGSTDNTLTILRELQVYFDDRLEILNQTNRGHGQSCLEGYRIASMHKIPYVLQIDSDGQCDPQYFSQFWQARDQFDVIYGHRTHREDGMSRSIISGILQAFLLLVTRTYCIDANVPYRLMKTAKISPSLLRIGAHFNLANIALAVLLKKAKLLHGKVEIRFRERLGGEPTVAIDQFGLKAIQLYQQLQKLLHTPAVVKTATSHRPARKSHLQENIATADSQG